MIRPRLSKVASGATLTTELVNGMINRTEYAADLLRQYKLTAGTDMYVEPHADGTRVSYYYPVSGGTTPRTPPVTNEITMELNKEYYFPLNFTDPISRLVFPKFANQNRSLYAIVINGGYWAYLDSALDPRNGFHYVFYAATILPSTILLTNYAKFGDASTPLPAIGPMPNGRNPNTGQSILGWTDAGSVKLIKV
jgi:hypothetical protein